MSKALYRKYRPLNLSQVVGQEQVTLPLRNSLKEGKINHAYLFIGPRGCGKTSVARIFAHEVNGFEYTVEDDYVDIIEIDGASNRGIDNIRELREKVAIAPTSGKYKVYIIDEVHMLTKEAFNALLKTLEEPPEHAIFIMATTDAYKVPVTITSRAQTYTFKLADMKVMFGFLKDITNKEKIAITDEALEIVVKRGGGSFRDSLSLLDQISTLSDKEITKELVIQAMGLPEDEKISALIDDYMSSDISSITSALKELLNSGIKPETISEEMIHQIIENPRPELMTLLAKLPEIKAPFAEAKLLVALMPLEESHSVLNKKSTGAVAQRVAVRESIAKTVVPQKSAEKKITSQTGPAKNTSEKETPSQVKAPVEPKAESVTSSDEQTTDFNWQDFFDKVNALNDAIGMQVSKCQHELIGTELHLYPDKRITKTILSRENNKRILVEASNGTKVVLHDAGDKPSGAKEDALLSKISDIMGGEVKNDGGQNPF